MRRRDAHEPQPQPVHAESGYSLLEVLVVIAILGMIVGLVAPAALRQLGGARVSITRQTIERLSSVLDIYQLDNGAFPSTSQSLEALNTRPTGANGWNGPYLRGEGVPMDPWGRPWIYRNPSTRSGRSYDLCSAGADGSASEGQLICNR